MGKTKLDLKELDLKDGENITYSIRVTDNRDVNINPDEMRAMIAAAQQKEGSDKGTKDS